MGIRDILNINAGETIPQLNKVYYNISNVINTDYENYYLYIFPSTPLQRTIQLGEYAYTYGKRFKEGTAIILETLKGILKIQNNYQYITTVIDDVSTFLLKAKINTKKLYTESTDGTTYYSFHNYFFFISDLNISLSEAICIFFESFIIDNVNSKMILTSVFSSVFHHYFPCEFISKVIQSRYSLQSDNVPKLIKIREDMNEIDKKVSEYKIPYEKDKTKISDLIKTIEDYKSSKDNFSKINSKLTSEIDILRQDLTNTIENYKSSNDNFSKINSKLTSEIDILRQDLINRIINECNDIIKRYKLNIKAPNPSSDLSVLKKYETDVLNQRNQTWRYKYLSFLFI